MNRKDYFREDFVSLTSNNINSTTDFQRIKLCFVLYTGRPQNCDTIGRMEILRGKNKSKRKNKAFSLKASFSKKNELKNPSGPSKYLLTANFEV